jgi:hypothetical protein
MIIKIQNPAFRQAHNGAQITRKYPHLCSVEPVKQGSSPPPSIPIVTLNMSYVKYKISLKEVEKWKNRGQQL